MRAVEGDMLRARGWIAVGLIPDAATRPPERRYEPSTRSPHSGSSLRRIYESFPTLHPGVGRSPCNALKPDSVVGGTRLAQLPDRYRERSRGREGIPNEERWQ